MDRLQEFFLKVLLGVGLFCPGLSLTTLALAQFTRWQTGGRSSAVLIPVIGPVLLSIWIWGSCHSLWFIPVVWFADPGTWILPALVRDSWEHRNRSRPG